MSNIQSNNFDLVSMAAQKFYNKFIIDTPAIVSVGIKPSKIKGKFYITVDLTDMSAKKHLPKFFHGIKVVYRHMETPQFACQIC